MAKQRTIYARRHALRALEKGWTVVERLINRLATLNVRTAPYNPLYHLGTLTIFLLIILTITGLYLVIFYRPGTDRAYASVAAMSANEFNLLVRTIHRYASDAIIVVTLLHALKMLVSDRFWGSRWFAWVSGWAMLVIIWVMGLLGYWLVWDQPAQWLTEYFVAVTGGPFAHSILGSTDLAAATYALFVIVLFLHVFIPPVILVGVLIHVVRLARSRYWSPRWLMVGSAIVLVLLALWRPAPLAAPADLSRLVEGATIDWLYLGFLPVTSWIGAPLLWSISLLILAAVIALPWLWRGQEEGIALVIEANCTGCSACARECPFDAIEMVQRDDETIYESLAVVSAAKCTGCGICVGACPDEAIELDRLYSHVVRQDLQRTSMNASATGEAPVTIYVCDRHAAMGTLPTLAAAQPLQQVGSVSDGSIPIMQAKLPPRVNVGAWSNAQGQLRPVITAVTPCTGMLHPDWAAELIEAGGAGAIVVSCPVDDCAYREGPHWIADRLKRRRTFRRGNTHFLELTPGSQKELLTLWSQMVEDEAKTTPASQRVTAVGKKLPETEKVDWWQKARYLSTGVIILLATFLISTLFNQPASNSLPEQGQLRLVINHGGELLSTVDNLDPEVADKLPDNIDPSMVLGGERHPVQMRVLVDGDIVLEQIYEPRGLRREGAIFGQETIWLEPGTYAVEIFLQDDGREWRTVFADQITVADGAVSTLLFDSNEEAFLVKEE